MAAGWIKLWRKLQDNPYLQEHDVRGVFVNMLLDAQREDRDVYCKKIGKVIHLKRGQL